VGDEHRLGLLRRRPHHRDRPAGGPACRRSAIAHPLAEGQIKPAQARLTMRRAAALYDAGLLAGESSDIAELAAAEAGVFCLDRAILTHGGNGVAL
jgi:hypothetical protein